MSSPMRLCLANSCPAFAIFFAYENNNNKKNLNEMYFFPYRHMKTDLQSTF